MQHEILMAREAGKVTTFMKQYVNLADSSNTATIMELFTNLHLCFPDYAIMTCPVMHPAMRYLSDNAADILGHSLDELKRCHNFEKFYSHTHPDDMEDLLNCFAFLHKFLMNILPLDHYQYRAVFYYRTEKNNGQYVHMRDEKVVLKLKDSRNLYYGLFRDITEERTFTGVKVEIFRQERILQKIKEYKPSAEGKTPSKRESEVLTLVRQGYSNKEIASHLKISSHTARNIKSKLFEKYNVNSTIALLNKTA